MQALQWSPCTELANMHLSKPGCLCDKIIMCDISNKSVKIELHLRIQYFLILMITTAYGLLSDATIK
jgi:hypothetical protein